MIKPITLSSIILLSIFISGCHASKKASSKVASTTTPVPAVPVKAIPDSVFIGFGPMLPPVSKNGIFMPGEQQLKAIQLTDQEVSLQTLTNGYTIYTGTCTNCHAAKDIYSRPTETWKGIIDGMAPLAKLSEVQKDAVYKYVLSIKATQPK